MNVGINPLPGNAKAAAGIEALQSHLTGSKGRLLSRVVVSKMAEEAKRKALDGLWMTASGIGERMKSLGMVHGGSRSQYAPAIWFTASGLTSRLFVDLGKAIFARIQELGGAIVPKASNKSGLLYVPLSEAGVYRRPGRKWGIDFVRSKGPIRIPPHFHLKNTIQYFLTHPAGRAKLNALIGADLTALWDAAAGAIGIHRKGGE